MLGRGRMNSETQWISKDCSTPDFVVSRGWGNPDLCRRMSLSCWNNSVGWQGTERHSSKYNETSVVKLNLFQKTVWVVIFSKIESCEELERWWWDRWEQCPLPPGHWRKAYLIWGTNRTANGIPAYMKIGDQKSYNTLKNQIGRQ